MTNQQFPPLQEPEPEPGIWDRFLPALGEGMEAVMDTPVIGPALQGLGKAFEFGSERIIQPPVSGALEYFPVGWETPESAGDLSPWQSLKQGKPVLNLDPFTKFQRDPVTGEQERKFSPGAAVEGMLSATPIGWAKAWREDWLDKGSPYYPGTVAAAKVGEAIGVKEQELGRETTRQEKRDIGEEIYKVPPYMRGTLEELPWFMIPSGGQASAGLKTLRMSARLAPKNLPGTIHATGGLGRAASTTARAGLRTGELALRPLEYTEKAFAYPFTLAGKGISRGLIPVRRRAAERMLDETYLKTANDNITNRTMTLEEGVDAMNKVVRIHFTAPVDDYFVISGNKVVRNAKAKLPNKVLYNNKGIFYKDRDELFDNQFLKPREVPEKKYAPTYVRGVNPAYRNIGLNTPVAARADSISAVDLKNIARRDFINESRTSPLEEGVIDRVGVAESFQNENFMTKFKTRWDAHNPNDPNQSTLWSEQQLARLSDVRQKYGAEAAQDYAEEINRLTVKAMDSLRDGVDYPVGELRRPIRNDGYVNETEATDRLAFNDRDISEPIRETSAPRQFVEDTEGAANRARWGRPDSYVWEEVPGRFRRSIPNPKFRWNYGLDVPDSANHALIKEMHRDGLLGKVARRDPDEIAKAGRESVFGLTADGYVKLIYSLHDSTYALRVLQDNSFRSRMGLFRHGSKQDLVAAVVLSPGAAIRAVNMYENLMRTQVVKHIGRREAHGLTQEDIDMVLQGKHLGELHEHIKRLKLENPTEAANIKRNVGQMYILRDLRPGEKQFIPSGVKIDVPKTKTAVRAIDEELITEDGKEIWRDSLQKKWRIPRERGGEGLTKEQAAQRLKYAIGSEDLPRDANGIISVKPLAGDDSVTGAAAVLDHYQHMRFQLLEEGFITKAQFDEWTRDFPNYNPIDYIEFADVPSSAGSLNRFRNPISDGVYNLSLANDVPLTAASPVGDLLLRRLLQQQVRITRNRASEAFVDNAMRSRIGLKDWTDYFDKTGRSPSYSEAKGTGYITFFKDGKKRIYGQGTDTPEEVDKVWWDALYGRAGLGVMGDREIENVFSLANSYFKSTYTTFDPLFMIGNGFIDQFTVALRYRIMPTTVWWRLARSIDRAIRPGAGEDRFKEMMEAAGGYQSRVYDVTSVAREMQRELNRVGHVNAQIVFPNQTRKLRDVLSDGARKYLKIPVIGEYVEQAPRLLVAEKTFKRLITEAYGKKEWRRLMDLDKNKWRDELYRDWKPGGGKGLGYGIMDSPEARHAAMNALESTINFNRGGDVIRRWNNYFMFLNASFEGTKMPFRMMGAKLHPEIRPAQDATAGRAFEFGGWEAGLGKRAGVTDRYDDILGPRLLGRDVPWLNTRGAAAITMASAMSAYSGLHIMHNFQHEEYWDIPSYIRYNGLVIMQPAKTDENGDVIVNPVTGRPDPNYVVIPHRLRELALFFGSITHIMERGFSDDPVSWKLWAKSTWKASSPINDLPLPELVSAAYEEASGIDLYRDEPIVNPDYADLPVEEQYTQYTSDAARIIADRLGDSGWMPETYKNPQRLDHLYDSAFGGIGRRIRDMTDYTINTLDALRKNEARSMESKVADYRKMDRTGRREMLASFTREEYEKFQKLIRQSPPPEGNVVEQLLEASGIQARFAPDRGGGLREMRRFIVSEEFPEIDYEEQRSQARLLGKMRTELRFRQQDDDASLDAWMNTGGGIDSKEWKERRSEKYSRIEGAELLTTWIFPAGFDPENQEQKSAWYEAFYTAAGRMQDERSAADLLIAAYYNIPTPEEVPGRTWSEYFEDRNGFFEHVRDRATNEGNLNLYDEFMRTLNASLTETEKDYNAHMKYLSSYWDVGDTLDSLLGEGADISYPQLSGRWQEYLHSGSARKNEIYQEDAQIRSVVQYRKQMRKNLVGRDALENGYPRMDYLLTFWYDWYDPVTIDAKQMKRKLWRGEGSGGIDILQ